MTTPPRNVAAARFGRLRSGLALAVLLSCLSATAEDRAAIVKRCKAATALVDLGLRGSGSAFCIRSDGLFLPNRHVVEEVGAGAEVDLVLNPAEEGERTLKARVVSISAGEFDDLALLWAEGEKDLTELELGDSDALFETAQVTALGYPFGRLLAQGEGYPSVSVNLGRVSALRRSAGKLAAVQIDAAVNPGNSGGPLVDDEGKVVGVVFASILRSGVSFAVPVNRAKDFLKKPGLAVDVPEVPYVDRHEARTFRVRVAAFDPAAAPDAVTLTFREEGQERRAFDATRDGDDFVVRAAPAAEPKQPLKLQLLIERGGDLVRHDVDNAELRVGGEPLDLVAIRKLERRADLHVVTLTDDRKLAGTVEGWDALGASDGKDLATADRIDVLVHDPGAPAVAFEVAASRGRDVLARQEGQIPLSGPPASADSELYSPDDPYSREMDEIVVEALIDGRSNLHVAPEGLYWEHQAWDKPGARDERGKYVVVNGSKWYPQWDHTSPETGHPDKSDIYPLKLGPGIWELRLMSIIDGDGGRANPGRGEIKLEPEVESATVEINDGPNGPGLYRFRLRKRRFFEPPLPPRDGGPTGGQWSFDGEEDGGLVRDTSGNGNDGRLALPGPVPGRVGQGLMLGRLAQVDCGDVGGFTGREPFSISTWIRSDSHDMGAVLSRMAAEHLRGYDIFLAGQRLHVHLIHQWEGNALRVIALDPLETGRWHHVVVTYDGSSLASGVRLYVDGRPAPAEITHDRLTETIKTDAPFRLGARTNGDLFRGALDEVRLYDRALTPEDARDLAAADGAALPDRLSEGLLAHWSCESAEGGTIPDASGHGRAGTLAVEDAAPRRVAGREGQALQLQGRGWVTVEGAGDFDGSDAFSCGAWVRVQDDRGMAVFSKMPNWGGNRGYTLEINGRRPRAYLIKDWGTRRGIEALCEAQLEPGRWHHVAMTYDGSGKGAGVTFYIDGRPAETRITTDGL